jgi:hypothetical protein
MLLSANRVCFIVLSKTFDYFFAYIKIRVLILKLSANLFTLASKLLHILAIHLNLLHHLLMIHFMLAI